MPAYMIIVPLLSGLILIITGLLAVVVDARLIRIETGHKIAPRYLSVAIENRERKPYLAVFIGNTIYAMCLPLTAIFQLRMAEIHHMDFTGSPLLVYALYGGLAAFLFALIPQLNKKSAIQTMLRIIHLVLTFLWIGMAAQHFLESQRLTTLMAEAGHLSPYALKLGDALVMFGLIGATITVITVIFATYAHYKLEVTWGWKKGSTAIREERVFLWSLIPFSLCIGQMIIVAGVGLSLILVAFEFALI